MNQTIKIQDIADQLESFEKEKSLLILSEELNGWNVWSFLKKPLYYILKNKNTNSVDAKPKRKRYSKFRLAISELVYYFRVLYWVFRKTHSDIIITSTANKLEKNTKGLFTDVFVDPLVYSGSIKEYLYIESSSYEIGRRPTEINAHIFHIGRPVVIKLLHYYYISKHKFKKKAKEWTELLNLHFQKNYYSSEINNKDILNLFGNFWAEYKWYLFLWRIQKPSRLFIVDGIPSGSMAAARKLGIPVWEFQHGFVTNNKVDYIISKKFLPVKRKMVIPNHICVFGNYFKELLLNNEFWNHDEIISLGSYAIENARNNLKYKPQTDKEPLNILWTTQPSVYNFTQKIFKELAISQLDNVRFYIKPHPLEKKENLDWYKKFTNDHAALFLLEPHIDFFQALKDKHLLIGFYSTTLLEALSLGYPVITIAAGQFDRGINNVLTKDLSHIIKPVSNVFQLISVINNLKGDKNMANTWSQESFKEGDLIFDNNYFPNLKKIFIESNQ